jgi:hypothetical protein
MVALRSPEETADEHAQLAPVPPRPDPADWLSLQHAACELDVSPSTIRRMIRKGQLRNRIVPRRGGFRYLIYLPNSRHAQMDAQRSCSAPAEKEPRRLRLIADTGARAWRDEAPPDDPIATEVRMLEVRAERLNRSLSRALLANRAAPPDALAVTEISPDDPYGRYRWLARRRRRWWQRP